MNIFKEIKPVIQWIIKLIIQRVIRYGGYGIKLIIECSSKCRCREIKWFIQRGKRGYSDKDVWAFDSYIAGMISNGIRTLEDHHHGCPSELWDESRVNNECWKWEEILEEIAQGFEASQKICDMDYFFAEENEDGLYEHKIDKKRLEQLTKKYKRGMELFSEHFMSMWN